MSIDREWLDAEARLMATMAQGRMMIFQALCKMLTDERARIMEQRKRDAEFERQRREVEALIAIHKQRSEVL